jgi:hypothetical protein
MMTSAVPLLSVPAKAQAASTQPVSGPLPSDVTVSFSVDTVAYISIRPKTVGLNQPFMVNMFPVPAPNEITKIAEFIR